VRAFKAQGVPGFQRQLEWERHYLDWASKNGCIIFWLPCESKDEPRQGNEPYAMDTRGEIGEWRGRLMNNSIFTTMNLVIGGEFGFPGLETIHRNFEQALREKFPIYPTLEETVKAAIIKATS